MLRKNIASVLCLALAVGLVSVAGCKKKDEGKAKSGDTKQAEMTPPAMDTEAMDRPVARRAAKSDAMGSMAAAPAAVPGRAGALPLPAEFLFVRINLKAARGTELYKAYEPKIKEMLTKAMAKDEKGMAKALIETCKLDPTTTMDEIAIGMSLETMQKGEAIVLVSGTFDTAKLIACMKPEMDKAKVESKEITIAGKKGMTIKNPKGEESTVLTISANSFAMATGGNQAKLADVLGGKSGSVEDSPLYKEYAAKAGADTVLTVLVPAMPAAMAAAAPIPLLKDIKSVATLIGLPGGGLDLKVALNLGDKDKAEKMAKSLPLLVGMAKARLPQVGEAIVQNLKIKADEGWVKLDLALDKPTFEKLTKTVKGLLGGAMKSKADAGGEPEDKPAAKDAKKGPKKGAKKAPK